MSNLPYRKNVAIFVLNHEGKILQCQRTDLATVWQIPQGGIDEGEHPQETLKRELFEEVGISEYALLGQLSQELRYDWPEALYDRGFRGQDQTYFVVQIKAGTEICFNADPRAEVEFGAYEWVTPDKFMDRIQGFKRPPYEKALELLLKEFGKFVYSK
ncbi:NUDIX domain-containing protein [bacterium]|nr:NUDIX domain-containing protein [bacterium]